MSNDFDLIQHPFNINKKEEILLFRIPNGFEMNFTLDIFSKKVQSTMISSNKNYIEVEIADGECKILSETNKINKFNNPADFYVKISEDARQLYTDIHKHIITDDLNSLTAYAIDLDIFLRDHDFPECPVPLITSSSHFENFSVNSVKKVDQNRIYCIQIRFGESIPNKPMEQIKSLLLDVIGEAAYELQHSILHTYFKLNKIAKYTEIQNYYIKNLSEEEKKVFRLFNLKKCLSEHAFFYKSGPWRHCWVAMGYDPSTDRQNYKYQVIYLKGRKEPFQIIERPQIIAEVDKNIDWYLLKECDPVLGFISKALKCFVLFSLSGDSSNVEEDNDRSTSNEELD